jgi:hypothetical protein
MGRSVPTYRMKLEELIAALAPYRKALREQDRMAFDALMNRARRYASASGYQASSDPMETAMLSMLLGLEKELERLRRLVGDEGGRPVDPQAFRKRLEDFDGRPDGEGPADGGRDADAPAPAAGPDGGKAEGH